MILTYPLTLRFVTNLKEKFLPVKNPKIRTPFIFENEQ